jgi:hypothetical protein
MRASIAFLAAALFASPGTPAQAPGCAGPAYSQFDFWVGTWSVENAGKPAGTNLIQKVLNGCALLETWQSVRDYRGHSLTLYDARRDLWHQTWIGTDGEPLYLEGRFTNGQMQLEGSRPAEKGGTVKHKIIWTALPQGGVRQHWTSSTDGGQTWTVAFDGYYRKVG